MGTYNSLLFKSNTIAWQAKSMFARHHLLNNASYDLPVPKFDGTFSIGFHFKNYFVSLFVLIIKFFCHSLFTVIKTLPL